MIKVRRLASKAFAVFVCVVLACGILLPAGTGSAWAENESSVDENPQAAADRAVTNDGDQQSVVEPNQQPSVGSGVEAADANGSNPQSLNVDKTAAAQADADAGEIATPYAEAGDDGLSDQDKVNKLLGVKWTGEYDGTHNDVVVLRNLEIQLEAASIGTANGDTELEGIAIFSPSDKELEGYGANGSYLISGTIDFDTDEIRLQGYKWIDTPAGFENDNWYFVTLMGTVDFDSMTISGASNEGIWEMATYESDQYEFDSGFALGVDNNSYAHYTGPADAGNVGFADVPHTYDVSSESFEILKTYFDKRSISTLKERESGALGWNGVCYGVAASMGLVHEGRLALSDMTSSDAATYFDLPLPSDDADLLNALNFYQLSQNAEHGGRGSAAISTAFPGSFFEKLSNLVTGKGLFESDSLSTFLQTLVENPTHAGIRIMGYVLGESGHTVLITGCTYDAEEGLYRIKIYDENTVEPAGYQEDEGAFSQMVVKDDFSEFWLLDEEGENIAHNNNFKLLSLVDLNQLPSYTQPYGAKARAASFAETTDAVDQSGSVTIDVSLSRPFAITSVEGTKLVYDGNVLSGDMEVRGADFSLDDSDSRLLLKVAPSASFTVEQAGSGIDASFTDPSGSHYYLKSDNAASAKVDFGTGMTISGENYDFTAFASTSKVVDANESGLLSVSGSASGDVTLSNDGEGIRLDGADAGDLTIGSYEGGDSYEKTVASAPNEYRFDHETVVSQDPADTDEPENPDSPDDLDDLDDPDDPNSADDPAKPNDPNNTENSDDQSDGRVEDPQGSSTDHQDNVKPIDTADAADGVEPKLARTGDPLGFAGAGTALVVLAGGIALLGVVGVLRRN